MTWFPWLKAFAPPKTLAEAPPSSTIGRVALEVAQGEIGRGEQGANNEGADLVRYRKGGPGGAWCAALISWCLEEAGARIEQPAPRRSHSAKTLFANCLKVGTRVESPAPGDIVLWHRGAANARTGHVGIVWRVEDGSFWSIEGNKGGGRLKSGLFVPSKVRIFQHEIGEALLLGFCRLR